MFPTPTVHTLRKNRDLSSVPFKKVRETVYVFSNQELGNYTDKTVRIIDSVNETQFIHDEFVNCDLHVEVSNINPNLFVLVRNDRGNMQNFDRLFPSMPIKLEVERIVRSSTK